MTEARQDRAAETRGIGMFQAGVGDMLAAAGKPDEVIEALLAFDLANFQFQRRAGKGEFLARMLRDGGFGLEVAEFQALGAVARLSCTGEVTVGDLAAEMHLGPSRASRLAADLVAKGYLERGAAQEDGRKSLLRMTQRAHAAFERFTEVKWAWFIKVFDDWSAAEITAFSRLFRRYVETSSRLMSGQ